MKIQHLLIFIFVVLALYGCGTDSTPITFTPPPPAALANSVTKITKTIQTAKGQADSILKLGAAPNSPDVQRLQLTLSVAQSDAASVQSNFDQYKQDSETQIDRANGEIKNQSSQKDAAVSAKNEMEPKHQRDIKWIFITGVVGALFCFVGPFLRAAWAPLLIIPSFIMGAVSAFAGLTVFYGFIGIMIAFGYL